MSVSVELLAKHSSAKDHLVMTGGTLSADRFVRTDGPGPLLLQHEFFPVAVVRTDAEPEALTRLYSGIHSIEHALASPEGGDLRARLDEAAGGSDEDGWGDGDGGSDGGELVGKRLIDMSPYVPGLLGAGLLDAGVGGVGTGIGNVGGGVDGGDGVGVGGEFVIGFRATFVGDGGLWSRDVVEAAYAQSLRVIRELFVGGGVVPFSTPAECGQYNLHSAPAAVELIDGAPAGGGSGGGSGVVSVGARELYVCDLRLVKPRLPEAFDQRVLDVLGGHVISQAVEREAWKFLAGAQAGTVTAGNFGCSTGEYLMVGNPGEMVREALLWDAHVAVARTLIELARYDGDDALGRVVADDARFAGEHIRRHGGGVWDWDQAEADGVERR